MKKIIDLGFDRILTSGKEESVEDGIQLIEELVKNSNRKISIMPGLKLRSSNIDKFLENKNITLEVNIHSFSEMAFDFIQFWIKLMIGIN